MPTPVADKMRRQQKRVFSEAAKERIAVRKIMRSALKSGLENQLYRRTPLPVTGAMRRAIITQSSKNTIAVGFNPRIAPHTEIRLAKAGRSKLGGHDMTLTLGEYIEIVAKDRIFAISRGSLERVFGA